MCGSMDMGPLMASCAAWVACWSVESMASISVVSARVWARHAVATEMATITAVAAAASLVMGGNLMINMFDMFDVAVVGAGPAGATAALTLARRGLKVALLEKAALPRYKTCGGALVARGLALFPPEIQTVIERRCGQAELHLLDGDLHYSSAREPPGPPIMAMTMRDRLDQMLASAASAAGAVLRAPCTVSGVSLDPRHVRLDTDTGPVTAVFVIAADGATGELARLAGWGDGRHLIPALEYEVHVDDATLDRFARVPRFDVGVVPCGYAWVFPKTAHLSVGVLTTRRGAINLHRWLEEYLRVIGLAPRSMERHGFVIPVRPRAGPLARQRSLPRGPSANAGRVARRPHAGPPTVRPPPRALLDVRAGGSAAGRSHHRRLHGRADVPRIGAGALRGPGAPPQHALVNRELRSRDPRPREPGRLRGPGAPHRRAALRVAQQRDRRLRPHRRVVLRDDHRLFAAVDHRAEAEVVRDDHRGAARHRLEQRDAERRDGRGAEVQIGRAVIRGAGAEYLPGEPHARAQLLGAPLVVAPPRPVSRHGEHGGGIARQNVRHRVEQRAQAVARLDAPEEQEPGVLGEGVAGLPAVGPEETRIYAVRDHVPIGAEVARVGVHHRLAHGDGRRVAVEDLLERPPEHAAAHRAREPRVKRGHDRDAGAPRGERRGQPERRGGPAVHVHDVVAPRTEQVLESAPQPPSRRNARHAPVGVDHAARAHPAHEVGVRVVPHAGRDDVRGVPPAVELQGEVVHVLGHAPELRIIVFGHQGDAHRATLRHCDPVAWAAVTLALRRATPANTAPGSSS